MGFISTITGKKKVEAMSRITEESINKALSSVIDPDLHKDIVSLGFVRNILIKGNEVSLEVNLTTPACPMKDLLKKQAYEALEEIPGIGDIKIKMTAVPSQQPKTTNEKSASPLAQVKNIIAVAAGKGGVGKSTTSLNLAKALSMTGAKVGLLDADIYGPSMALMTGTGKPTEMQGDLVVPPESGHIKVISVSMFTEKDQAQVLRGPMIGNLVKQFLTQVAWGELDYLIIDYPPGTGDIQLTISQTVPITAAVVVTTPQEIALMDVRKSISMFETLKVPVLGIIENMSYFLCDNCNKKHYIFSKGGGKATAEKLGLPLLGEIPMDPAVMSACEKSQAAVESLPEAASSKAYVSAMSNTVRELEILKNNHDARLDSFHLTWRT